MIEAYSRSTPGTTPQRPKPVPPRRDSRAGRRFRIFNELKGVGGIDGERLNMIKPHLRIG